MPALAAVLDAIARSVLGEGDDADVRLGTVTLRPHQREALRRVRDAIAEFGGALLADEPGLGKTFVALALAREHPSAIVAAPAALRGMWLAAAASAHVSPTFLSLEALSRRDPSRRATLVIVDEAHHACNPRAARYARLARLCAGARVLLLSATPVRNRRAELDVLLALFLGPRSGVLDDAARSRCIIRRSGDTLELPQIDGPHWHAAPATRDSARAIARGIAGLPPPLPVLDGREARALLAMTLARCWASSLAALDAALRRRLQRGAALAAVLDAGRVPTRAELRAWVVGDDAVQLAFPLLVSRAEADSAHMRRVLREHLDAVHALRSRIAPQVPRDANARASLLARIRATHPHERIVAFTSYAATAEALYRALRSKPGVVLLTARGARSASGARPREDVLRALGPGVATRPRSAIDDISLVLSTDVLSEGVNLQGASVVVHLDIPWTPAGLDQRVGRAARMGSAHARVHVYGIAAPAGAERLLTLERRFQCKHGERLAATSSSSDLERLRQRVAPWRLCEPSSGAPRAAGVRGGRAGFVAVIRAGAGTLVAAGVRRGGRRWMVSDSPRHVCECLEAVRENASVEADVAAVASARGAMNRWLAHRRARDASGIAHGASSVARRRLLLRLDALLESASPETRVLLRARVGHLRGLVAASEGAGAELDLDELSQRSGADDASLLDAIELRLTVAGAATRATAARDHPFVEWLLIVSPRDARIRVSSPPAP